MKSDSWWIRIGKSVLSLAVIALITVGLGEAVLRIYNHFNPVFIFYDEYTNRFRGKPFAKDYDFTLNSRGFKDLEFGEKHGYRILGLGDSFAFAVVPYRYNYLTLLENDLQSIRPGVEVLNMGIPDTGPREYLQLLVEEGLPLQPDLVLLSFFIGNDFTRPEPRPRWSHSYVATLLHYALTIRPKVEGRVYHGGNDYCDDCPPMDTQTFFKVERKKLGLVRRNDPEFQPLLDNALAYLLRIRDLCAARGIALVVAVIPDEMQVNAALFGEIRERFAPAVPPADWDLEWPNRELAKRLTAAGITHVDLYPQLAAASRGGRVYRPQDTHWNIAGNRLAADVLARQLAELLREAK